MFGYQENLELYLNLSRKELQGLCKKNNLPANRSNTQLAKSLASFFKKKNTRPASSKEKSSSPVELPFDKSFAPDTKPKETANSSENNTKGSYERRTNSSESDSYRVAPCVKERKGDDRRHSQSGNQMEISILIDNQTLENAYNTAAYAVCPNKESPEGFCCSTSEAGNEGIRPSVAADVQQIATDARLSSDCHTGGNKNESQKSPELRNYGQQLLNPTVTNSETRNLALVPCIQPIVAECSAKSVFLSSEEISKEATPSFEFFAMSEEGINLHVELNSSPSEWISSLKDDLCINLKTQHHKSRTLPNHTGGFSEVDEHMKISPFENIGMNIQNKGVEKNTGCTTSTLSSVSENCQSEAYQPDATVVSSEYSVLTSSCIPVEMSECLDGNRAVSSSFVTHANVQKQMAFDTSCPGHGNVFPQDSVDVSFLQDSVPDISLKPIGNMDVLSPEGTRNPEKMECHTLKIANDDSNYVEVNTLDNSLISISEENNLLKSDETEKNVVASDIGNLENGSDACQASIEIGPMEGSLEVAGHHNRSSSSCQLGVKPIVDCPVTKAESDAGSADHLLNHHACSLENSIAKDPVSAFNDELGKSTSVKEKESSEYPRFQNSSDKNSKRTHSPEFHEEFQSKRHHSNGENKSGMMVNLRSTRTSAKETTADQVVRPRRSTRLLSK